MTQTPTKAEELARELEQQQVSNWIHSTGTPPRVNGTKPDPLCQDAAAELRRLSAVEAERDALRAGTERWRSLYTRAINEANGLTNYVEDRPELRRAEKQLEAIQREARAIDAAMKGTT